MNRDSPSTTRSVGERIGWLLAIFVVQLGYIPINRLAAGGVALRTPLDSLIPLWSIWGYPYVASLALWIIGFIWAAARMDYRRFRALALAAIGVMLVSYAIFIVFPTYVDRPTEVATGIGADVIRAIYSTDRAYNAFPSGHTYTTVLLALFFWVWKPRLRVVWATLAVVIVLSTLFTRQHYVPDLIAGIIVAALGYWLGNSASKRWPEGGLLADKRFMRGLWIAAMAVCVGPLAILVVSYASLPVDGATGDLSSFSDKGFEVNAILEPRPGGLQVGDVITRLGGHTVEEWILGATPGAGWQGEAPVIYQIIRDGQPMTLSITLSPLMPISLVNRWGAQIAIMAVLLALGLFLAWQRPNDPAARLMALMCWAIVLELGPDGYNIQPATLAWRGLFWLRFVVEHLAYTLIFASIVHFVIVFPLDNPLLKRWPRLIPIAAYALMPALIAIAMSLSPSWSTAMDKGNVSSFVAAMIMGVAGMTVFVRNLRAAKDPVTRAQIRWMLWAVGLATAIGVPGYIIPEIMIGRPLIPLGIITLTSLLLPVVAVIAILRYRLFDIEFIINRTLVYGALTVVLGAVFAAVLLGLGEVFRLITGQPQPPTLAVAAAGVAAALLFQPVRFRLRRFVDRRFYGIKVDYYRPVQVHYTDGGLAGSELGQYHLGQMLGQGGMAEVYRSVQPGLNRDVAIKILSARHAEDSSFRRRFMLEAQTVAGLRHANIVQLYDYGEFNGVYYMVMEYLPGQTLRVELQERGALPIEEATGILTEIASALDYAHTQQLVHRDVKPGNIVLEKIAAVQPGGPTQRAVLTDFGIARILRADSEHTPQDGVIGTLNYIAPEQIQEAPDLDGRADEYALGVMAYLMYTGRLPFRGTHAGALVMAHLFEPPSDLRNHRPEIPPNISLAVLRTLEKTPDLRFATVGEFVKALHNPAWGLQPGGTEPLFAPQGA